MSNLPATALLQSPLAMQALPCKPLLEEADFGRVCRLILGRAGIALGSNRRHMVHGRLMPRMHALGAPSFAAYLTVLESHPEHPEWEHFVNALTINTTSFFRERHHFRILADHVRHRTVPVSIWSCAAATGQEAYSIAMMLVETLGPRAAQARVLATDVNTHALAQARAGIYTLGEVGKLDAERRRRFFLRGSGTQANQARVKAQLQSRVQFAPLNLVAPNWPKMGPFDAIFCRNLMIYFNRDGQQALLRRLAPLLKPDGLLFAGHSENFSYFQHPFALRGQSVYTLKKGASTVAIDAYANAHQGTGR